MAFETIDTNHRKTKLIISLMLMFSLGGDILLLNNGEKNYFVFALLCFLVAHILYIIFFLRIKQFSIKKPAAIVSAFLLIFTYQFLFLNVIWQKIKEADFLFPVVVYSVSIALMFISAVNTSNGRRARKVAWRNFIPGAALFIISDSLLAVEKFYPFITAPKDLVAGLNCTVMLTYGAAQFLLVSGSLKFIKS